MRAVVYVRTFEDDEDCTNIVKLNKEPKKLIASENLTYISTYSDIECSGKTDISERRDLKNLFNDAKEKKFDIVVIYSIGVLAQTRELLKKIYSGLIELGVKVISCTEKLESLDILQVARKHVSVADLLPKAIPYGYKRVGNEFVIDERAAKTIRLIFEYHCVNLYSINKIKNLLNEKGIMTSRGGNTWHVSVVEHIIKNKYKYDGGIIGEAEEKVVRWPRILDEKWVLPNKVVRNKNRTIEKPSKNDD